MRTSHVVFGVSLQQMLSQVTVSLTTHSKVAVILARGAEGVADILRLKEILGFDRPATCVSVLCMS